MALEFSTNDVVRSDFARDSSCVSASIRHMFPAAPYKSNDLQNSLSGKIHAITFESSEADLWSASRRLTLDAYIGSILQVAFGWAPDGWLMCDGSSVAVNQYQALFALIEDTFGGSGTTSFNLPDLRARVVIGANATTAYKLGTAGGASTVDITVAQLPIHTHAATFSGTASPVTVGATLQAYPSATNTTGAPAAGSVLATVSDGAAQGAPQIYAPAAVGPAVNLGGLTVTASNSAAAGTIAVAAAGAGATLPLALPPPPFLALNSIICVMGIYPSRP